VKKEISVEKHYPIHYCEKIIDAPKKIAGGIIRGKTIIKGK
jgi:hypothetical protein